MKKGQSSGRRSASKPTTPTTVDDYLARASEPARRMLKKMRATIRSVVSREASEVISYRMPAFKHDGVLVWYAAFANHVSLFPASAVVDAFKDELSQFNTSKGTIQF